MSTIQILIVLGFMSLIVIELVAHMRTAKTNAKKFTYCWEKYQRIRDGYPEAKRSLNMLKGFDNPRVHATLKKRFAEINLEVLETEYALVATIYNSQRPAKVRDKLITLEKKIKAVWRVYEEIRIAIKDHGLDNASTMFTGKINGVGIRDKSRRAP